MTDRKIPVPRLNDAVLIVTPLLIAVGIPAGKWLALLVAHTFGLSG
jgi:hypothetical protein